MSDEFSVRSRSGGYAVSFVPDFAEPLARLVEAGSLVICDEHVYEVHEARIRLAVPEDRLLLVEATETNKTIESCTRLLETFVDRHVRRDQAVVAIGGGVIQDITAFSCSVLYRGIAWEFFPTTLLAQADSCIGSKTSINLGERKNLVGSFHPPRAIHTDIRFLESLPEADIRSGIGEMMHYFVYADSPMLDAIAIDADRLVRERANLVPYIRASLEIKRGVIEKDELDQDERQKFNYGHTFGHALEAATRYAINHGQAVTVGMDLANYLSVRASLLDEAEFLRLHEVFAGNFPDYEWQALDIDVYIQALSADKKNTSTDLTCILCEGRGKLLKRVLPMDGNLAEDIRAYFTSGLGAP